MKQADAELARRWAKNGDRDAMRQLYERHAETVYAFARGMTGNGDTATEVLQETFLRAARSCGSFKGKSRFSTWLMAIARSAAHDIGRARARRDRDSRLGPPVRPVNNPLENCSTSELAEQVRQAVMRLPERQRAAVTLCELQELSLAEAAQILGWRVGRLKSTLFRARENLKKELAGYCSEPSDVVWQET